MRTFSVSSNELKFGDRLVPSFYYYTKIVKLENLKKGMKYIELEQYSDVSDGEHSHISRNSKSGIRYLYGRNIKEGIIDFDPISDDSYINPIDYKSFTRCHINQNDVLIAIYGTIGKSAVYRKEHIGEAGIPRHISNISLKSNAPITPEYLTSFFRSKMGKWQLFSVTTGNIQQLLSLKNLRKLEIPVIDQKIMDIVTDKEKEAIECEIAAQEKIKEAQKIFYDGLYCDLNSIKKEDSFVVKFSELEKNNVWSTNFYNKLYVNTAELLKNSNGTRTLRELTESINGDEVGSDNYNEFVERNELDIPFIRTSDIVNYETDIYPDYYIPPEALEDINQDIVASDVIFTKDGKVGCVGMITESDNVILSSGIVRLRLNDDAIALGFTQEYLFIALSIVEVGYYSAIRRTVVASTIPHLREDRLKDMEIPIEDKTHIDKITKLVAEAFSLKARRKQVMKESDAIMHEYFKR